MRRTGDTREYIASYVDDLVMALKKPTEVTNALRNKGTSSKELDQFPTILVVITSATLTVLYTSVLNPTLKR